MDGLTDMLGGSRIKNARLMNSVGRFEKFRSTPLPRGSLAFARFPLGGTP